MIPILQYKIGDLLSPPVVLELLELGLLLIQEVIQLGLQVKVIVLHLHMFLATMVMMIQQSLFPLNSKVLKLHILVIMPLLMQLIMEFIFEELFSSLINGMIQCQLYLNQEEMLFMDITFRWKM